METVNLGIVVSSFVTVTEGDDNFITVTAGGDANYVWNDVFELLFVRNH